MFSCSSFLLLWMKCWKRDWFGWNVCSPAQLSPVQSCQICDLAKGRDGRKLFLYAHGSSCATRPVSSGRAVRGEMGVVFCRGTWLIAVLAGRCCWDSSTELSDSKNGKYFIFNCRHSTFSTHLQFDTQSWPMLFVVFSSHLQTWMGLGSAQAQAIGVLPYPSWPPQRSKAPLATWQYKHLVLQYLCPSNQKRKV